MMKKRDRFGDMQWVKCCDDVLQQKVLRCVAMTVKMLLEL